MKEKDFTNQKKKEKRIDAQLRKCNFEKDDSYYYISDGGDIKLDTWEDWAIDYDRYLNKNCFLTKAEAVKYLKKIEIEKVLREWADTCDKPVDWTDASQEKYCLTYNHLDKELFICFCYMLQSVGTTYFTNSDVLRNAIEDIGEENLMEYYGYPF